ncbi:MAG: hypothetical protein CMM03_03685 [Rhodopirellula sp.]|nr:hypothetical protein [Rhodopirellula sp.]
MINKQCRSIGKFIANFLIPSLLLQLPVIAQGQERVSKSDYYLGFGFRFEKIDGICRFMLTDVYKHSPAYQAGLKKHSVIIGLTGKPLAELLNKCTADELLMELRQRNLVNFEIADGDKSIFVELTKGPIRYPTWRPGLSFYKEHCKDIADSNERIEICKTNWKRSMYVGQYFWERSYDGEHIYAVEGPCSPKNRVLMPLKYGGFSLSKATSILRKACNLD